MGKATGFLEYKRAERPAADPLLRTENFREFHEELPQDERKEQAARCMNCGVPFCQSNFGCPLHNLIPEWNDHICKGNWRHAADRLLKTNNFPEFTGRVCPAMCESACLCGRFGDESVSVRDNELALIEYAYAHDLVKPRIPAVRTGLKVSVIGSGPAGLAVADQLNYRGHSVSVYERDDRAGGLLMYGIPSMKLDKSVVDRRVQRMRDEGVDFILNVDAACIADEILAGSDAVVLCCGAREPREVPIEDSKDAGGVVQALEYLTESTRAVIDGRESHISARGKNVTVIGNGDTATDCVATAVRQGAVSVTQLVRKPAPAGTKIVWPYRSRSSEPDYGQEEAVAKFGRDPRMYSTKARKLKTDESGNLTGITVDTAGSEHELDSELLITAAGFSGAESYVPSAFGLTPDGRGRLGGADYRTAEPKVFSAGDMRRGASLVAAAIADGRACANAVDEFLEGYTNL